MPKISVLMPTYNTKKDYLKESIESILNQTYSDFELIILDDGSKDNISDFINSYNDKRIQFYKNEENIGVSASRNKLINLAQGEYAAWQDADDISYPERLEKEMVFLDKNPEISIVGSLLETFPNKKIVYVPKKPKLLDFIGGCIVRQPSVMFKLSEFKKHNLYYNSNLITSEDYDLWARAVKILNFANIQEPLVKYRMSGSSLYHTSNKYSYKIDKEIKQNLANELTENKKLQSIILKAVNIEYQKKYSILENIFSIRNEWRGDKKVKILVILGLKIKLNELKERYAKN